MLLKDAIDAKGIHKMFEHAASSLGITARETMTWRINLSSYHFDHAHANGIIRAKFHAEAQRRDAAQTAYLTCLNKGHDWHVRSQAAYDAGYDEPMNCWRCGEWDM